MSSSGLAWGLLLGVAVLLIVSPLPMLPTGPLAGAAPLEPIGPPSVAGPRPGTGAAEHPMVPGPAERNNPPADSARPTRPLASVPAGAIFETPAPAPPATTPTTYVLLSQSKNSSVTQFIDVPSQRWGMILLNYTGQAVAGVYDSSYFADVAGVPVLFGTTPEYGQWTVLKDITEYESLLSGNVSVQFVLGRAVTNGYFLTSFSLSFYPAPQGTSPPREPDQVVPLWPYTSETDTAPNTTVVSTVPTNVVNATLEVYAYGFTGGRGLDEFWYQTYPAFREIQIDVNNTTFATILPFPYINTGGIDLYAWDPITGVLTLNDRPYQVSVTAALGLLEGTHPFKIQVLGRLPQARWIAGGSLLLYTNSSTHAATLAAFRAPHTVYRNTSATGSTDENVSIAYSYSSDIPSTTGTTHVAAWTNESFDDLNTQSSSTAGNLQVQNSTTRDGEWTQFAERASLVGASDWLNSTARYLLTMNSTTRLNGTGAVGTYINQTVLLHSLGQRWNESRLDTERTGAGVARSGYSFNDVVGANGNYADEELIVSAGAAQIVHVYFNYQNTTKDYASSVTASPLVAYYNHTLSGRLASVNAPQQTVTLDLPTVHDAAGASIVQPTTDAGQATRFDATALGAGGPFRFQWSGLPTECMNTTGPTISCAGTTIGTVRVYVTAIGATGNSAVSHTVSWTILPDPTATVAAAPAAIDFGQSVNLTATVTGGAAPYRCDWEAEGVPLVSQQSPCRLTVTYAPTGAAPVNVTLNVTDALGLVVHASPVAIAVAPDPGVALLITTGMDSVPSGTVVTLQAHVSGGIAPYTFAWSSNGKAVTDGVVGPNYTFTPVTAGTRTITVTVTDHVGYAITSTAAVVKVTSGPSPGTTTNGSGAGSEAAPLPAAAILGIVGVAGVLVISLLLVLRWPKKK